ncbi:MAG TPA: MmcQ/YjbR family DNA-binding protein [Gammaproteobacteria bacterium]|nr:MmcQ/YjbR family DNA-binding protein [Gammaproteobacteria bacterium]
MRVDAVRRFALSLPEATEEPHFHYTSFRIGGKIFATMPPGNDLLHVFVPEEDREAATAAHPDICESLHWGKRVVGVRVELTKASASLVEDLLRAAYDSKSQKRKQ